MPGIRQWALLEGLSPEVVREFLAGARRRRFAQGEVIFHEGDPADTLHLIESGRVAVRVATPSGDVATLAVRRPGEAVGELALIDAPQQRAATLIAVEPVETMAVRRSEFERLITENPRVLEVLVRILADQVRQLNAQVLESRYIPADVRVRRRIMELADVPADGVAPRPIVTTQEELAALAGTTRGTVNRVVREEVRRGTLHTARGKMTVLDPVALARRAR